MQLTRKQFLDIAGPGALGAAAYSALGLRGRAEAREVREGAAPGPTSRPFSFKATAAAFGGQMELPFPDLLEVQASTVLPPSGGRGSARAENFRYGQVENARYLHIASFGAAQSEVLGAQRQIDRGGNKVTQFETLATVTVTDLRIGDAVSHVITAGKIVGQLTSSRTSDEDTPLQHVESRIEGLQIDGQEVKLDLHDGLLKSTTFTSLVEQMYQGFRPPVLDHKGEPLRWTQPAGWKKGDPYPDVMLRTSVFREPPAVKPPLVALPGGCRIVVETNRKKWVITLGELEITPQSRRLTMLRVDMEPNQKGTVVAAVVEGDGRPPP
jgi:hypothetical protein